MATGEKPLVKDVRTLTFPPRGSCLAAGTGYGALTVWRTKGALLRRVGGSWDVIGERLPRDQLSGTNAVSWTRGPR
ncbi:hypothetical protein ACWCQW_25515 [Streptomyces mirabilis]